MPDGKHSVRRIVLFSGVSVHNNFVDLISYNGAKFTYKRKLTFALITDHNSYETVHIQLQLNISVNDFV